MSRRHFGRSSGQVFIPFLVLLFGPVAVGAAVFVVAWPLAWVGAHVVPLFSRPATCISSRLVDHPLDAAATSLSQWPSFCREPDRPKNLTREPKTESETQ